MRKTAAVLAALLAALMLAGCGSRAETKKMAGSWYCDVDVTQQMNDAALEALGVAATSGSTMTLRMVFTLQPDGAYTLGYDTAAVRTALDNYSAALRTAAAESIYAAAEAQGYDREEYDAAMEQAGITVEQMADAVFDGIDDQELVSLLTGDSAGSSGYCKAESGRLHMADSADALEDADYVSYIWDSEGVMRWTVDSGVLLQQLTEQERTLVQFPLVWTKAE